jgi:hypothetical protein
VGAAVQGRYVLKRVDERRFGNDEHVVEGAGKVVAGRENVDAIVSTDLDHAEGTLAQIFNSR